MSDLIYEGTSFKVLKNTQPFPDLISTIDNGIGGIYSVNYKPSSSYGNHYLPFIVQTVSSISVNDDNPNGNTISTTDYWYWDGLFDADEREFRGFAHVQSWSTDPAGATSDTWFFQDAIFKGLPYKQVVTADSPYQDSIYTWTENIYTYVSPYTGVSFSYLYQKDDYVCDGTVQFQTGPDSCRHATVLFLGYDTYGNVTRRYFWGDVAVSGDERDEYTEYYYDTAKWVVSLPSHTWINDYTTAKKAEAWFDYDTNGNLSTKTLGLVLGNKTHLDNPKITYSSYRYGNAETITDARGYPTTVSYYSATNPTYTYPVTKTNYLGHSVSATYDEKFGKPLIETDPNGNTTVYTYDPFGRIKTVTTPDDGVPAYAWKETYYDGLGRTVRAKTGGPDGKVIVSEPLYNNRGQVWRASLPYFEGARPACLTNGNVFAGCTTYYYDPIGRVTDVQNPDNTVVSKRHMQGRTTIIDANDHVKVEEKDVYGRLIKAEEYTGTDPNVTLYATTRYVYDVLGNLTDVYDAALTPNHTQINYDSLSRKISMNDPDMGHWEYAYDANGNLVWQKDAKNQIIQFQYDPLNRIKLKDYPTGTDVTYAYDETFSTYSKGRLTTVTDASGTEKYYYDRSGKSRTTIKTVDGVNYQIDTTYDELGRVASIRYPDNETIGYGYDTGGNLTGAGGYATYGGFNALGQAGSINYGNGVSTTLQYYSSNNRLYKITTNSPTQGGLQNLSYGYYNNGNIWTITDGIDGNRTQTFTYDDLDRLTQAVSSSYIVTLGTSTISYQYNEIGNMTLNSRVSPAQYTYWKQVYGTKPHAVYQAGSNTYQYDANGNMSVRNSVTITYDYDDRVTNVGSVASVYDYAGHRVKKNGTVYIGKLYECNGSNCTKYIFAGSSRIASKSSSDTSYYHTDHLGSSSVITNAPGNRAQETYYYPFGETRYNSGSATHYKFTGQEEDAETGLYYYGARYYDPAIGRFISADTVVPNYSDPQGLNRYTYTRNNPLMYVDPTGHAFWFTDFYPATEEEFDAKIRLTEGDADTRSSTGKAPIVQFFSAIGLPSVGTTIVGYADPIIKSEAFLGISELLGFSQLNAVFFRQDFRGREYSETERSNEFGLFILSSLSPFKVGKITTEAVESTATKGMMNPNEIRFSQDSIRAAFKDPAFGTINDLATGLKSGNINPGSIEPIRLIEREGHLITIDNRRLEAFRRAGVNVPTRMASQAEIQQAIQQGKFSAGELGGITIRVRVQ